jgi:preprotein translocase subunit SecE
MKTDAPKTFDAVAFFREVKEKMARVTEGMSLQEEREYWRQLREETVKLV